jgi:hypothetical protein
MGDMNEPDYLTDNIGGRILACLEFGNTPVQFQWPYPKGPGGKSRAVRRARKRLALIHEKMPNVKIKGLVDQVRGNCGPDEVCYRFRHHLSTELPEPH